MIQAVIHNIMVYWSHLYAISKKILQNIRKVFMNFMWNGRKDKGKYHLAKWEQIMKPNNCGGWGLRDLFLFGRALLMKSLWRGLKSNGIWSEILKYKYPELEDLEKLYCMGWNNKKGGSVIYNGFKSCWSDFSFFFAGSSGMEGRFKLEVR